MNRKTTIGLFYTGVAVICIGIIAIANWIGKALKEPYQSTVAVQTGKESAPQWFPIEKDLAAVNQLNESVNLSDLRGKVWIVAEFFAVCPNCAVRNGNELKKLYDEFRSHPDFHIACISIDPKFDDVEKLDAYGKALGADPKNWWFLNAGDLEATHEYLEKTLKFFKIRSRIDPLDIETNGKYDHDLGFILVDREFNVVGKWSLAGARKDDGKTFGPEYYQKLRDELYARIRAELDKNETPGI